jgi:Ig-like domain-containing protein/SdrD B-like protein
MKKIHVFTFCLLIALLVSACGPASGNPAEEAASVRAWFDAPLPNSTFLPPNPCQIVGHGASPNGIAAFELSINGAVSANIPSPDKQGSLVTLTQDCGLSEPGNYLLQMRVQDNAGEWSGYAETSLIILNGETSTCTNQLDVTFEDPLQKTYMTPGQKFTKSWTVQNVGTCTWGEGYHLVFRGGPSMSEGGASLGAPLETLLGSLVSIPVLPGQKVIIPLDQTAPMEPGWYVGAWGLNTPSGEAVTITHGTDVDSTASFYVDIVVKTGTPTTTGDIGGAVFADQNGNGLQDSSEGPLEGVLVTLKGCGPNATQTTATDGTFQFTNVPAGSCTLEVSKVGWMFSGSSPNLGYPLPVASNPSLPTNVGILMAPVSNNISGSSFGMPQLSSGLVYYGGTRCDPNRITVQIKAQHPDGIKVMVFFHRLHELNGNKDSGWSEGFSMNTDGKGLYTLSTSGDRLVGNTGFTTQAIVSYQFVMQTQKGEFVRSEVYSDLYVSPCGSPRPPAPGATQTPGIDLLPLIITTPTIPIPR